MDDQSERWNERLELIVKFSGRWRNIHNGREAHVSDVVLLMGGFYGVLYTLAGVVDAVPVVTPVEVFRATYERLPSNEVSRV